MQQPDIEALFDRWLSGTISPREKALLADWIARSGDRELEQRLEQAWKTFTPGETIPSGKADELLRTIMGNSDNQAEMSVRRPLGRRPLYVRLRKYGIAAAVLLGVFCSAGLYWFGKNSSATKPIAVIPKEVTPPKTSNAVITLANGKRILLDSVRNGSVVQQGRTDLVKLGEGQVAYRGQDPHANLQWNTISVPIGSRIASLTLSDGTQVWLNSGSSMTYPVAFEGKERQVAVNGEVYFEVAKDRNHPFVVKKGDVRVNVLGTHFNMNAYDDEGKIRVTLLEGSIEVSNLAARHIVTPGQMAILEADRSIAIDKEVDPDRVMAWRNGRFDFGNADIHSIMRELSRWYGVEVEFREPVSEKFYLETSRDINVSDVFRILETTGGVHFKTEGKKVIVMR
ncbi:MAG TPA: FecR domain-containing protein [Puia sp.]|nr:FecR domain-containing protein [Puia sp.]